MAISIPNKPIHANVVIGAAGSHNSVLSITGTDSAHTASPVYVSNGTTGANWASSKHSATMTAKGKLKVEGEEADIYINGLSLSDWMSAVEQRLSILRPRPELLEKYEALQEAYDHYKTLESLLYEQE
jgi:hypothetical protein